MDQTLQALNRLTEGEKECLRRRLQGESAKVSALAMGVSPHAVEKRLKMARAKLGLSSSLAAARLLADLEAGRLVPRPPALVLAAAAGPAPAGTHRRVLTGAFAMLLIALLAALPQASAPLPASPPSGRPTNKAELEALTRRRPATEAEARAFVEEAWQITDRNRSGFIEGWEAPTLFPRLDPDGDGRITHDEFVADRLPLIRRYGVPADWPYRD